MDIIKSAIEESSNPIKNLVVYHGTSTDILNNCTLSKDGHKFIKAKTLISTSLEEDIVAEYTYAGTGKPLILEIDVPYGYPALWVEPISEYDDENLLSDDTIFQLLCYEKDVSGTEKVYDKATVKVLER